MRHLTALAPLLLLAACETADVAQPSALALRFDDRAWNGEKVPDGQQCKRFGGQGATPAMGVAGIPKGATAILVEFNDRDFPPLASKGGHGIIGWRLGQQDGGAFATLIPPVPGQSDVLPEGVFKVSGHRSAAPENSPGTAYLPPCSGGQKHAYYAVVKAVVWPPKPGEEPQTLAIGSIEMGVY